MIFAIVATFIILAILSDFLWTALNIIVCEIALVVAVFPLVLFFLLMLVTGTILGAGIYTVYGLKSLSSYVYSLLMV